MKKERWRSFFDGYYEVSDLGRIRRAKSGGGSWVGRISSYYPDKEGYLICKLCANYVKKYVRVHVVVMLVFRGPCPPGKEVNHKDGVKSNCKLSNLEYKTPKQNIRHAQRLGLFSKKLEVVDVHKIRELAGSMSNRKLALKFNVSDVLVGLIIKRLSWGWVK